MPEGLDAHCDISSWLKAYGRECSVCHESSTEGETIILRMTDDLEDVMARCRA